MEICVFGAGSIGCYVGGRLAATRTTVTFIGRPRLAAELRQHGLRLTDYRGADLRVAPASVRFATDPSGAAGADFVLVSVKSAGTVEAGAELAKVLKPDAIVASFQNGVHNVEVLRAALPGRTVLTGMVPFNVLHRGDGAFHQGTGGDLMIDVHPALEPFLGAFAAAGLPLRTHPDMQAVQWGKLLINLKNAINALAGVPIIEELSDPAFRRCWSMAQIEALDLLDAAGIRPAKATPLPPRWLPALLRLPNFIFLRVKMVKVDPLARSSMWEDLQARRTTEVDWLNGEVVRLAQKLGRSAPVNAKLVALIREAEKGGKRDWKGAELLAELRRSAA
jgi:2-dehydropantoate 2-reductase